MIENIKEKTMINQNELKYYIEDLQSEEIDALFSVRLIRYYGTTLSGDRPSHVVTTTHNPYDGWTDEDMETLDLALQTIANILRNRFVEGQQ